MAIHKSAEDYLESILVLSKELPYVRSIDIAKDLNFSKPSVSVAMKKLNGSNHIHIDSNGHITLTEKGLQIATNIYSRHVVISNFLQKIGVSEKQSLIDACLIEHDISDETFSKLKQFINK